MASMQHSAHEESADDPAFAPESGQPEGGRDNPWEDAQGEGESDATWPPPVHGAPKDEL